MEGFAGGDKLASGGIATESSTVNEGATKLTRAGETNGNFEKEKTAKRTETSEYPRWELDLKSVQGGAASVSLESY